MKNSENAFKIVSAETRYMLVSFKKKKSHKFITRHTVKHLVQKELFLIFLYTKHAYDILSKKFIEDSVPIKTTPETLKKAGILAENVFTARGLSILTRQHHLTVTYQHLVCHFVKETLSLNIIIYLILFPYVCHHKSRAMEGNLGFRD